MHTATSNLWTIFTAFTLPSWKQHVLLSHLSSTWLWLSSYQGLGKGEDGDHWLFFYSRWKRMTSSLAALWVPIFQKGDPVQLWDPEVKTFPNLKTTVEHFSSALTRFRQKSHSSRVTYMVSDSSLSFISEELDCDIYSLKT